MSSPDLTRPPGDYLRSPLPPQPGVCHVCRGSTDPSYSRCFTCARHKKASRTVADAVVPIAYCTKGGQHYEDLKRYKNPPITPLARARLRAIAESFLQRHRPCLVAAAGGPITHLAVVPSTKRDGVHPLAVLLGIERIVIPATGVQAEHSREFHPGMFRTDWRPARGQNARVLLLDDTWTTGSTLQSFAHTLKQAGATAVVAVVLGRLLNEEFQPSRKILNAVAGKPFDVNSCAACHDPMTFGR